MLQDQSEPQLPPILDDVIAVDRSRDVNAAGTAGDVRDKILVTSEALVDVMSHRSWEKFSVSCTFKRVLPDESVAEGTNVEASRVNRKFSLYVVDVWWWTDFDETKANNLLFVNMHLV